MGGIIPCTGNPVNYKMKKAEQEDAFASLCFLTGMFYDQLPQSSPGALSSLPRWMDCAFNSELELALSPLSCISQSIFPQQWGKNRKCVFKLFYSFWNICLEAILKFSAGANNDQGTFRSI